jgi:transcriptional regulator with XRE-family HTH domain
MYRKRAAFSQATIARLLGVESAAEMSRHEHNRRLPTLDTALAYEVILGAPVGELFAGKRERMEQVIARRAKRLLREIDHAGAQLDALTRIANLSFDP